MVGPSIGKLEHTQDRGEKYWVLIRHIEFWSQFGTRNVTTREELSTTTQSLLPTASGPAIFTELIYCQT